MATDKPSKVEQALLFARNFIKHPTMLGTPMTSSRYLVDRLLRHVDWHRARVVVEYGPGVGTITVEVLRRMHPDARLVAIETNRDFVEHLESHVDDPRLTVLHESAAEVGSLLAKLGLEGSDYVISGIPFTSIPKDVREAVAKATREVLKPDGTFLVYQVRGAVLPYLERHFREVTQELEPLNPPPMRLFFARP